jgi:hypothetical protein
MEKKITKQIEKIYPSEFGPLSGGTLPYDYLSLIQMGYQKYRQNPKELLMAWQ